MPNYQLSLLVSILEYNTTNYLDLLLNNFKEDISLEVSNNSKEKIKLVNTRSNNNEYSRFIDKNKQRLIILN